MRSEIVVNSRFTTAVQRVILRVHTRLDDEALACPEVQRKLSILRNLSDGSAYGVLFDPLGFVGVLNVGLSLGLELVVLYLRVRFQRHCFGPVQNLTKSARSILLIDGCLPSPLPS